jgi:SEC-C motif-containing protein
MIDVGRNDPCPCGSGKKYKKCCLLKAGVASGAYTDAERMSAQVALGRFSRRHEFDDGGATAEAWFGDSALDIVSEDDPEVMEQGDAFFHDWFTLDFRLASGQTLVDVFLEREGELLRWGERQYLERARLTHLRLYEVLDVRLDDGFDLLDLWADERVRVQERLATHQVVQWNVLGARVMPGPTGVPVIDGQPYLYPARAKDALMKELRGLHRKLRKDVADDVEFFKSVGSLFFLWWIDHVVAVPPVEVHTAEGDEIVFARAVFDIRDREVLERALAACPDLHQQRDGSYAWHEATGKKQSRRSLGVFVPDKKRVVFETTSKPRATRGRAFLEALAGEAVRYRVTRFESAQAAMDRLPADPRPAASEIPPEVQAEIVGAYYEEHYRGWVNTPLPALRGRTPRDAARSKTARPRVIALLKDMESHAARERLEGRPAYDFGWMWGELGLERPSH